MAKIALGTWAWGTGAFGGDIVFGSHTNAENLKPVFDAAMNKKEGTVKDEFPCPHCRAHLTKRKLDRAWVT